MAVSDGGAVVTHSDAVIHSAGFSQRLDALFTRDSWPKVDITAADHVERLTDHDGS